MKSTLREIQTFSLEAGDIEMGDTFTLPAFAVSPRQQ
jgi:hypothetical protein